MVRSRNVDVQNGTSLAGSLRASEHASRHPLLAKLQRLGSRPFVRNVATLATGTAAAQAIAMAFTPVITRLYGPEAYGTQGVFVSVAGVAATVAALTYPIAIVLPKSDAEAGGLARLSIAVGVATALLAGLMLLLCGRPLLALLNAETITAFTWLIPVFMVVSVLNETATQWLVRKEAFRLSAKISVWQALAIGGAKAGVGTIQPSAGALIVINSLGALLQAPLLLRGLRRLPRASAPEPTPVAPRLWSLARRYRDFPMLRAPQLLLNSASRSLPTLMLAAFFGPAAAGFYAIANSVVGIPTTLIGGAVGQVFYPRINEAALRGEPIRHQIVRTTLGMAAVGALPYALVALGGPALFAFVFGAPWETAGSYARWLSPWLFLNYLNRPAVAAIPVLGLQKGLLAYEVFSSGSKVAALALGFFLLKSEIAAVALFSLAGIAAYAFLILWVIQRSGRPPVTAASPPGEAADVRQAS